MATSIRVGIKLRRASLFASLVVSACVALVLLTSCVNRPSADVGSGERWQLVSRSATSEKEPPRVLGRNASSILVSFPVNEDTGGKEHCSAPIASIKEVRVSGDVARVIVNWWQRGCHASWLRYNVRIDESRDRTLELQWQESPEVAMSPGSNCQLYLDGAIGRTTQQGCEPRLRSKVVSRNCLQLVLLAEVATHTKKPAPWPAIGPVTFMVYGCEHS